MIIFKTLLIIIFINFVLNSFDEPFNEKYEITLGKHMFSKRFKKVIIHYVTMKIGNKVTNVPIRSGIMEYYEKNIEPNITKLYLYRFGTNNINGLKFKNNFKNILETIAFKHIKKNIEIIEGKCSENCNITPIHDLKTYNIMIDYVRQCSEEYISIFENLSESSIILNLNNTITVNNFNINDEIIIYHNTNKNKIKFYVNIKDLVLYKKQNKRIINQTCSNILNEIMPFYFDNNINN